MTNFKTPLQKKLDAKHKKNTLASNKYHNKAWGESFKITPSNNTDIDVIEYERLERIKNYTNSLK